MRRILGVTVLAVALLAATAAPAGAAGERSQSVRKLTHSTHVLAFFKNPEHLWLSAPSKEGCWQVPWSKTCRIARGLIRDHTWQSKRLKRQLWFNFPTSSDWQTSVKIVQRAFPGTEGWLLSCSGAEGGHSRWVVYGGGSYYPGAEYSNTFHGDMVGGPLQYMWGTFKGHYRHGLDSLRSRGFHVDLPPVSDVAAWRSMTAQAIAGGWAILNGQRSHWSASYGSGC